MGSNAMGLNTTDNFGMKNVCQRDIEDCILNPWKSTEMSEL